jgi:Ca2+-binding RTX toxin-like protein
MQDVRTGRTIALAVLLVAAGLTLAGPAQALTAKPTWKCRGSVGYVVLNGGDRAEPVAANGNVNTARGESPDRALCSSDEVGAGNLPAPLGIPSDLLAARTTSAITSIVPELGQASEQKVSATGRVEKLTLQIPQGGRVTIGATVADATATGQCADGTPRLSGSSRLVGLTLGGVPISADRLVAALTDALSSLAPLVTVKVNEVIRTPDSLTVRALHIDVLQGSRTLLDAVIAESKVGVDGDVCSSENKPSGRVDICPKGSDYDGARNLCFIPAGTGGTDLGEIIVGKPFQGPAGGAVLPVDVARRRYGNSACLSGPGRKYAIVGTRKRDRLTGTNQADRMLGLGGGDTLDGGRGNDCLDGSDGNDNLSGAVGDDRVYGERGNDRLNGGPGRDVLIAGVGNDTINAAFGADRTFGGPGNDAINISTAGPPASADCGRGKDKVRINRRERHRIRGCETVYALADA